MLKNKISFLEQIGEGPTWRTLESSSRQYRKWLSRVKAVKMIKVDRKSIGETEMTRHTLGLNEEMTNGVKEGRNPE